MIVKINPDEAALSLARGADDEQSRFINVFSKELRAICKTEHLAELQICSMSDNLDEHSIYLIKTIAEFLQQRGK